MRIKQNITILTKKFGVFTKVGSPKYVPIQPTYFLYFQTCHKTPTTKYAREIKQTARKNNYLPQKYHQ